MRQGIVVTALLGVFVAIAAIFVGGPSLFTTPLVAPPASASAAARAADALPWAHRTAGGIARSNVASAGMADMLGLLHWFSAGVAGLDLGKGHDTQFGFAALASRATATATAAPVVAFATPASASVAEPETALAATVQPYAVAALPTRQASDMEETDALGAPPVVAERERERAAAAAADFQRLTVAAGGGDLAAKYKLGIMYRDGRGVTRDAAAAAVWLLAAAKGGNPLAEIALGEMYDSGTGVDRDPAAAYRWLDLAASASTDAPDRSLALIERDRVAAALSVTSLQ